jgi:hypothetical protein
MKLFTTLVFISFFMATFSGCATYRAQEIVPTPIHQAQEEIPEEQLLDIGILVFQSDELSPDDALEEGTNAQIRKAEGHFIPYHLKNTLHQSSHWGAIQVIPSKADSVDLTVKGTILKSNGEQLMVEIEVMDATGKTWLHKKYLAEANEYFYSGNKLGEKDAFQDLYDTIANDMAALKDTLEPSDIDNIRQVSKLKTARAYAPDAFGNHLKEDKKGRLVVNRLPADDDPMMERLLKVREREYMYFDMLNQYYEGFYEQMWPNYENWRKMSLAEQQAIKKVKRDALMRQLIGAGLIIGAVLAGTSDSDVAASLSPAMAIIGGQVIIDGFNVSKEAEIHASAIQELSESFGNEMKPVFLEFEGRRIELTGSAEEQYAHWKALLKRIYEAETGFVQDTPAENSEVN